MKVACFSESPADDAALHILAAAILGRPTEPVWHAGLRRREGGGWNSTLSVLPSVLKELHLHTDADGLVLILDSDNTPPHLPAHDETGGSEAKCRLCQLRGIAYQVLARVSPRPHLPPLKIAFGLAVPSIEAWLLCGVNPQVTEAAWINGLRESPPRKPYSTQDLKRELYNTTHPSLSLATEKMKEAASRLSENLSLLEQLFPHGYRALADSLRSW